MTRFQIAETATCVFQFGDELLAEVSRKWRRWVRVERNVDCWRRKT